MKHYREKFSWSLFWALNSDCVEYIGSLFEKHCCIRCKMICSASLSCQSVCLSLICDLHCFVKARILLRCWCTLRCELSVSPSDTWSDTSSDPEAGIHSFCSAPGGLSSVLHMFFPRNVSFTHILCSGVTNGEEALSVSATCMLTQTGACNFPNH